MEASSFSSANSARDLLSYWEGGRGLERATRGTSREKGRGPHRVWEASTKAGAAGSQPRDQRAHGLLPGMSSFDLARFSTSPEGVEGSGSGRPRVPKEVPGPVLLGSTLCGLQRHPD